MLRLRVRGFKNLRDIDVRFGPLTCFVGPNGVGKSNVFDAVQFLHLLADDEIQRAAEAVRSPTAGRFGPQELFWDHGPNGEMFLSADMIVPGAVTDDFGQQVKPAITLLHYEVSFRCETEPSPRLTLLREELSPVKKRDASKLIGFPHSSEFRTTVRSELADKRTAGDVRPSHGSDERGSEGRSCDAADGDRALEPRKLAFGLVADGTSDRALLRVIHWTLRENFSDLMTLELGTWPRRAAEELSSVLDRAVARWSPDVMFVHRDAETESLDSRRAEIPRSFEATVRVVPVRMTETWLLIDEKATVRQRTIPTDRLLSGYRAQTGWRHRQTPKEDCTTRWSLPAREASAAERGSSETSGSACSVWRSRFPILPHFASSRPFVRLSGRRSRSWAPGLETTVEWAVDADRMTVAQQRPRGARCAGA